MLFHRCSFAVFELFYRCCFTDAGHFSTDAITEPYPAMVELVRSRHCAPLYRLAMIGCEADGFPVERHLN
jgi:hypothetical protein